MRKILIILLIIGLVWSCVKTPTTKIDVSTISVAFNVCRFEQDFYKADVTTLDQVKQKYPLLFPKEHDSVWLNKINNKDEQELFKAVTLKFADFNGQKLELEQLFKHVKYYHSNFKVPDVVTIQTNMDDRVIYADSLLFISLDNFLGKSSGFYDDYPLYIKESNTKQHVIVDVAKAIIDRQVPPFKKRRFLERIIYEGKKMYLLDAYLPEVSDILKIGYMEKKMRWMLDNEQQVWRFFIDRGYLYSTDIKLNKRFVDLSPFSKFYLEHDNQSPGRVGVYVGWQVVRSYMNNNKNVSLHELILKGEEEIFNKSGYNPK